MKTMQVTCNGLTMIFSPDTLSFTFISGNGTWNWSNTYTPCFSVGGTTISFLDAGHITHEYWNTGVGNGIISHFDGFSFDGMQSDFSFETITWIERSDCTLHFEFIPLSEKGLQITEVRWPGYMEFDKDSKEWYTLLNIMQGLLIPNDWPVELAHIPFDGHMGTSGCYMPWFGQIKERQGYLAICEQPADAGFYALHPATDSFTHVGIRWYPSLGTISYRRTMLYHFFEDCDYNTLCKAYRTYTMERGTFRSLQGKNISAPVDTLVGCAFVHAGIKTEVQPDSRFFDPKAPDKNNHVTAFETRIKEIRHYHDDLGISKLYLHLDGWAEPGYDNMHPDYYPACKKAGGWEGMKGLADTLHQYGYLFGIHDQYRDYYFAAPSFDLNFATKCADGTYPEHSNWAGGHQTYLCATQAPYYVKRNFSFLKEQNIKLDCAYLDVFTCNEADECSHPWHRMTREECYQYRGHCFSYLLSQGILPSSEEVSDWAIPSLVFSHYAPYEFMMHPHGTLQYGIAVPLFNLVYHDALIIPWMMEKYEDEDYMLYALLNGGAPYLIRNGAYQNTDGAFKDNLELSEEEMKQRCHVVSSLHEKIAYCEMVSHEFIEQDPKRQKTVFSDGTTVLIDLHTGSYKIDTISPQ